MSGRAWGWRWFVARGKYIEIDMKAKHPSIHWVFRLTDGVSVIRVVVQFCSKRGDQALRRRRPRT